MSRRRNSKSRGTTPAAVPVYAHRLGSRATLLTCGEEQFLLSVFGANGCYTVSFATILGIHKNKTLVFGDELWSTNLWTTQRPSVLLADVAERLVKSYDFKFPLELVYDYGGVLMNRKPMIYIPKEIQQ